MFINGAQKLVRLTLGIYLTEHLQKSEILVEGISSDHRL